MRATYISILFLGICSFNFGQSDFLYENAKLGLRFESVNERTTEATANSDTFILENKNHNIRIQICQMVTNLSANACLNDLLLVEGFCKQGDEFFVEFDNKKVTAVMAGCLKMHKPYRVLMIAVEKSNGFNIISATCPEDCFKNQFEKMDKLLSSFEFYTIEESSVYYTSKRISG